MKTMKKVNQKAFGGLLPGDLMLEVLSRLPVKSLLRFKIVSKQFLCLISSPSLRKLHHHLHPNPKQHLLRIFTPQIKGIKYPISLYVFDLVDEKLRSNFDLPPEPVQFRSKCHGLLLFSDDIAKDIYVCNPSTHELLKLPESPLASTRSTVPVPQIAMGFLHESNTYKILVLFRNKNNGNHEFEVCTLEDGGFASWSSVNGHLNLDEHWPSNPRDCVSVDGVAYWKTFLLGFYLRRVRPMKLLAFDFRTQGFEVIHGPTHSHAFSSTSLAELRGRLCVVETWVENGRRITIISVQRCRNEWEKLWEIGEIFPHRVLAFVPAAVNRENHLCCVDGQEEEDYEIVYTHHRKLDLCDYNIKNKSLTRRSSNPSRYRYDGHWSGAFVYDDTLFSLKPLADLQGE